MCNSKSQQQAPTVAAVAPDAQQQQQQQQEAADAAITDVTDRLNAQVSTNQSTTCVCVHLDGQRGPDP